MKPSTLVRRGLTHYWRTNIAVILGVATAVTVLAGAFLVGDSVRGSLRDLVLQRLGRTDFVIASTNFFREQLADDVRADPTFTTEFGDICPIVVVQGLVTDQASGKRVLGVQVYGVDDRFWKFHGLGLESAAPGSTAREVLLSPALARDIGAEPGGTVLLRIQRPTDIPIDSMHGRKDDLGRTLRLTLTRVLTTMELGEFSLQPQQAEVRAAFVPLARLQQELNLPMRVNAMIATAVQSTAEAMPALETLIRRHAALEDLGVEVRALDSQGVLSLEARGTLIEDSRATVSIAAASALSMTTMPVFTYLVDTIRVESRQGRTEVLRDERKVSGVPRQNVDTDDAAVIPYSLVTAIDLRTIAPGLDVTNLTQPPIVLNEWAARDLHAKIGDAVILDYRVWEDPGLLKPASATFQLAHIVPLQGAAADRNLVPDFPGVTGTEALRDWDPPFPIDLRRVRPVDEDYWRQYRTTPKAFIPLGTGQSLWQSRHGSLTSIRLTPKTGLPLEPLEDIRRQYVDRLRAELDPLTHGLSVQNVRQESLAASRGATDFGEYFTYFSFFLVVSALLLAVLFFKLGVEQRGREVGLLRAVGFTAASVRRLFTYEAFVVSIVGSLLGVLGAVAYGALMMTGLRTWWVDAVGTTALDLHVSPISLAAGGAGGVLAAIAGIWWTLRSLKDVSERSLLAGRVSNDPEAATLLAPDATGRRRSRWGAPNAAAAAVCFLVLGFALIAAGLVGIIGETGAFFGAGSALLASSLCGLAAWLHRPAARRLAGHGWWPLTQLGFRNAAHRPGRSVLSVAVMASATFVLISVGAFRKDDARLAIDPHSGTGGYPLLVNTLLPIVYDPNSAEGRELLGLENRPDISVTPFRVLPGDDASCLNLYEPRQPRIIAAGPSFIAANRFSFQQSLATSPEDRANPWQLLDGSTGDGTIPVIADANSMAYVLHKSLGEEIVITRGGTPIRLRLVAALADSLFQGELIMSEAHFRRLFPDQPGYQFLLVDSANHPAAEIASTIEDRLSDFGADAMPTAQRLAEFHRVENTYLSTFQTLGGLGLLLGTIGLAAVLLRNVIERRRELALLGAVGYRRADIFTIVMAENAFLLLAGLVAGTACALVAVAPAALQQGGRLPVGAGAWLLLFAVLTTGLLSSFIATRLTLRMQLLGALKAE